MGLNSKLVTKIIGASIADVPSSIRGCKNASTYNFISGTGKKGELEQNRFADCMNKIFEFLDILKIL